MLAFDEDEESIDIQYFDGELDQLDLEEWEEMSLEVIEQPEDWGGPMDKLEKDDLGYEEL